MASLQRGALPVGEEEDALLLHVLDLDGPVLEELEDDLSVFLDAAAPSSGALDFLARVVVLVVVMVLVGLSLLWAGADAPSGGLLAAMGLLAIMAGLLPVPAPGGRRLRLVLLAGPFAGLGGAGWFVVDAVLDHPDGIGKPVIMAMEAAATASMAITLALLVLGPAAGRKA